MTIRKAEEKDITRIIELLGQVLQIHADIRPDIFIPGTTKYTVEESGNYGYRVYASGNTGTIVENSTSTAAFTNVRSRSPITGDNSDLLLWLGISGISGVGLLLLTLLRKKYN